jgi:hypothetical protein
MARVSPEITDSVVPWNPGLKRRPAARALITTTVVFLGSQ